MTLDDVCKQLIIYGTPDKVADELQKFREQVGEFGTLLYAGKDWKDRELGRRSMVLLAEKVLPQLNAQPGTEGGRGAMSRPRVFVTQPIAESALQRLRAVADVEVNPDSSRVLDKAGLIAGVKRADILLSLLHDVVDRDVLVANPQLKAVSSMNITQDRIDLAAATELGIPVTNIPAIVTDATADIAFALLLAVARNIVLGDRLFRAGTYPGSQSNHLAGAAVSGATLGLVGFGRIGQAVARRGRGFDMKIIYCRSAPSAGRRGAASSGRAIGASRMCCARRTSSRCIRSSRRRPAIS